jgi:ribonuclease P protein component
VQRNRLRRRLKEIVRQVEGRLDPKWDLVIVSKQNSAMLSFATLQQRVWELLSRLGVLALPS